MSDGIPLPEAIKISPTSVFSCNFLANAEDTAPLPIIKTLKILKIT